MTTHGVALEAPTLTDDGRLFCYRHPDRETYVRCGRCDRPICTRCAMQGPVGFRCKQCGTLANDPLTTMRPTQIVLGTLVAVGGAAVAGLIGSQIGFFGIFIAFLAGGIIAEAVTRVTGYKRGPTILAVLLGGIVAGTILGPVLSYGFYTTQLGGMGSLILRGLPWIAISAGAACFGAYSRLR